MAKTLRAVERDFTTTAPYRTTSVVMIARPQQAVFSAIADDPAGWGAWFPGFSRTGRYTTPEPHTVGSERTMRLGGLTFHETVIAWDTPKVWGFRVDRAPMPGVRALAELYEIEAINRGCTLTWTVAMDVAPAAAPMTRLTRASANRLLRRVAARLEKHLPPDLV